MSEKIEGTIFLDGLLEGRLPKTPGAEERLREWQSFARSHKLGFNLQLEGGTFSLLAESTAVPVEDFGPVPSETVREALEQFLRIFPSEARRTVTSTVRSVEYRKGAEAQTLYLVGPEGTIQVRERTLSTTTREAAKKLTGREKIYVVSIAVLVALLALLLSSFFVNYRVMIRALVEGITPVDAAELTIETPHLGKYFIVEKKTLSSDRRELLITLKRTETYPLDEAALQKRYEEAGSSVPSRLALEALARGYVRCELFDREGKFLGFSTQRIAGLHQSETVELRIPLPAQGRPTRLVITY